MDVMGFSRNFIFKMTGYTGQLWLFKSIFSDMRPAQQFLRLVSLISWELRLGGGCQYSSPQNRGETTARLERAAQIEPSQPCFGNAPAFEGQRLTFFENEFEKTANLDSITSDRPSVSWPKPFWKREYLQSISAKTWNNFLLLFRQKVIFPWTFFFPIKSHFEGQCFLKLGNGLLETALMMTV